MSHSACSVCLGASILSKKESASSSAYMIKEEMTEMITAVEMITIVEMTTMIEVTIMIEVTTMIIQEIMTIADVVVIVMHGAVTQGITHTNALDAAAGTTGALVVNIASIVYSAETQ